MSSSDNDDDDLDITLDERLARIPEKRWILRKRTMPRDQQPRLIARAARALRVHARVLVALALPQGFDYDELAQLPRDPADDIADVHRIAAEIEERKKREPVEVIL
jgi:hypothetical protein